MPFNASRYYTNPSAETISAFTDPLGILFFGVVMFIVMGYVLLKTENWVSATAVGLLISLMFAAALPALVLYIIGIAAVFVFAAVLIDVVLLN